MSTTRSSGLRPVLLLALVAAARGATAPVAAQSDAPLARTAARFETDLADLARLATAAVLVRDRTGAFPATPFELLGAPEAAETLARRFPLSELSVSAAGDSLALRYVPLPVSPYIREDLVVTATVRPEADGRYTVTHEMRRRRDAEDGGGALLYGRAGEVRVERGFGRLCIDPVQARARLAAGTYGPGTALFTASDRLTLRVHPPGEAAPVFYEASLTATP